MAPKKRAYTFRDLVNIGIELGCRVRLELIPVELLQAPVKDSVAKDSAGALPESQSVGRRVETKRRRTSSKVDPSGRGAR